MKLAERMTRIGVEGAFEVLTPSGASRFKSSCIGFGAEHPLPFRRGKDRGFFLVVGGFGPSSPPHTKMLVLNAPKTPTGGVLPADDIRAIADMVRDRDLM